jgi:hypothetical protein
VRIWALAGLATAASDAAALTSSVSVPGSRMGAIGPIF